MYYNRELKRTQQKGDNLFRVVENSIENVLLPTLLSLNAEQFEQSFSVGR